MFLRKREIFIVFLYMLSESYRGTSKFINPIWYTEGLCQQSFSDILMVLKNTRLKSSERIYIIDFSFSQNQFFRYVCLSVPNFSLVENILDTFCIAQTLCDHSILRMITVIKCRGYANFELTKIYEGHFQLIYNLVMLS